MAIGGQDVGKPIASRVNFRERLEARLPLRLIDDIGGWLNS